MMMLRMILLRRMVKRITFWKMRLGVMMSRKLILRRMMLLMLNSASHAPHVLSKPVYSKYAHGRRAMYAENCKSNAADQVARASAVVMVHGHVTRAFFSQNATLRHRPQVLCKPAGSKWIWIYRKKSAQKDLDTWRKRENAAR